MIPAQRSRLSHPARCAALIGHDNARPELGAVTRSSPSLAADIPQLGTVAASATIIRRGQSPLMPLNAKRAAIKSP